MKEKTKKHLKDLNNTGYPSDIKNLREAIKYVLKELESIRDG